MATLQAQNLAKFYKGKIVVEDVSLTVRSAEIVGLLGPNGAGKTTTFYMLVGVVKCDAGTIFVDDHEITKLPLSTRARLGISYLPQDTSIFRGLTVFDNLMAVLELRSELTQNQCRELAHSLLKQFNISHLCNQLGHVLSGGEKRRVEIARALAINPKFILLDEPFAGVDPLSILELKKIIYELRDRGLGILITDHNVRETLDACKHAYIVNKGRLLLHGTPEEILNDAMVKRVYLGKSFEL